MPKAAIFPGWRADTFLHIPMNALRVCIPLCAPACAHLLRWPCAQILFRPPSTPSFSTLTEHAIKRFPRVIPPNALATNPPPQTTISLPASAPLHPTPDLTDG